MTRILLALFILSSCSSVPKPAVGSSGAHGQPKAVVPTAPPLEIAPTPKGTAAFLARVVTSVGDNRAPRFSPDGAKLLFLSSSRPSHKHAQVYELELSRMTEHRVTFHDGDDEGAGWAAGGQKIVYSSMTDEMKEDVSLARIKSVYEASKETTAPNGIRPIVTMSGGDVYLQRLDGRDIERLTSTSAADTSPTADVSSKSARIVYASNRTGDKRLYLFDGKSTRVISQGPDSNPSFSSDGKALVWERLLSADKTASTQLMMTENLKTAVPLTSPGFTDRQPSWNAKNDAVVFSSNRGGKNFDLYMIDRKASCLKRLTHVRVDLAWPSISSDGSKIAFSARVNGQNQIYTMEERSASLPCEAAP